MARMSSGYHIRGREASIAERARSPLPVVVGRVDRAERGGGPRRCLELLARDPEHQRVAERALGAQRVGPEPRLLAKPQGSRDRRAPLVLRVALDADVRRVETPEGERREQTT